MKQVIASKKGVKVLEVPPSLVEKGTVLVEVEYSFISSGTELATLRALGINRNEDNTEKISSTISQSRELINKVFNYLKKQGVKKTVERIFTRLSDNDLVSDHLITLGYSCSGRVISVGEGVNGFGVGDLVACAGANCATHSELVVVPENLVLPIPEGCGIKDASSVAVGSIAMQGVRQSDVRMGEFVGVIGLGLVGLLTVRLLKIAGCRVFGLDIDEKRVSQALKIGADFALAKPELFINFINNETEFMGLDRCIITASSDSGEIIKTAMETTRQKGRVVALGFVPMSIMKNPFMRKEIEFVGSSSYGPGRYDPKYEDEGFDYPYSYVRWTEKRNMAEYLRLLASGQLDLSLIANEEVSLLTVREGYDQLIKGDNQLPGIFINYTSDRTLEEKSHTIIQLASKPSSGKVRLAIIGAGSFVRDVHLPNLVKLKDQVKISAIANKKGASSLEIAKDYGADFVSTSLDDIIASKDIDAVLIGTRHDTHSEIVLKCLEAGKHVFVEKPLAIQWDALNKIKEYYDNIKGDQKVPLLLTGFNRRFSPYIEKIKRLTEKRNSPIVMNYQINTKCLNKEHWQRSKEGGGRNLGEACHIYDVFTFLAGAEVEKISALSIGNNDEIFGRNENFSATISFKDGSIGNLTYTSLGSRAYPKEIFHVFCDQSVFYLNNYRNLEIFGPLEEKYSTDVTEKGHFKELETFFLAIQSAFDWPIPLWQQIQASSIALHIEELLETPV